MVGGVYRTGLDWVNRADAQQPLKRKSQINLVNGSVTVIESTDIHYHLKRLGGSDGHLTPIHYTVSSSL